MVKKDTPAEVLPQESATKHEKSWEAPYARIAGVLFFLSPLLLVVINYSIGFGCSSCYGEEGTPLVAFEEMVISDTLRQSPTKWTGRACMLLTIIAGGFVGGFRYIRLRNVPSGLCGNISKYNGPLFILLGLAAVSTGIVAMTPERTEYDMYDYHTIGLIGMAACTFGYGVVQVFVIERSLLKDGLICSKHHMIRCKVIKVALVTLAMGVTTVVLVQCQIFQKKSAMFKICRTVDLISEIMSTSLLLGALGLTDFALVPFNCKASVTGESAC